MPKSEESGAPPEVTHIAGLDVTISDRYLRQRCAWCDEILLDYDLSTIAFAITSDDPNPNPRPATWPVGEMVRTDGCVSSTVDEPKLPDDFCGAALFLSPSDFVAPSA